MRWLAICALLWMPPLAVAAEDAEAQRYLDFVAELKLALKRGDPAAVALLVQFPLQVNQPGETHLEIADARTLQARFAEVFTPSCASACRAQSWKARSASAAMTI